MTLPGSTLEIFPVTLGGNPFGWTADEAASCAVLDTFAAAGGNIIDSADAYSEWVDGNVGGESETILGRWMASRGNRDQIMVATKVALLGARKGLRHDNVVAALDDSLRRLGTDHIDLYYAHYDDPDVAIHDQVATFHSLVRSGKARAIGLSNFTAERMREWFDTAQREGMTMPSAIQPRYSLMKRADYERDYAQIAAAYDVAVFSYPALASGFLTGKYRVEADFEGKPPRQRSSALLRSRRPASRRHSGGNSRAPRFAAGLRRDRLVARQGHHCTHRLGLPTRTTRGHHGSAVPAFERRRRLLTR